MVGDRLYVVDLYMKYFFEGLLELWVYDIVYEGVGKVVVEYEVVSK